MKTRRATARRFSQKHLSCSHGSHLVVEKARGTVAALSGREAIPALSPAMLKKQILFQPQ